MGKHTNKTNQFEDTKYKLFYGIAVALLIYMGFSAVTTYQDFMKALETYNSTFADEWFTFVKSLLAAIIPCIVYATTMYGIGYILKEKH